MGRANPNAARRAFVKGSGIFGKYAFRGLSYIAENAIAFLGLTITIAGLFLVSGVFGLTVPVIVAAAESVVASLAGMPLLAATVALAAAIAAPETLKKIYKECTEWVVAMYKNAVTNLFKPKNFDITQEELEFKQAKPKNEGNVKYDSLKSYKDAKEAQYEGIAKGKTADLDLAGNAGKRTFKAVANGLADGFEWVAGAPSYLASFLPGFSSCCRKPDSSVKNINIREPLMKGDERHNPSESPRMTMTNV